MTLTPAEIDGFWTQGFVQRVPALTPEEAAGYLAQLDAIEAEQQARLGGPWTKRDYRPWEDEAHPLAAWLDALARHPRVLDAVASVLGPDILVRNADVFVKAPGLRRGIGWHQDTAVQGEDADRLVTVWLGLTPSTVANGGMQFSAGSHRRTFEGGPTDRHTLTFTREAAALLDPAATVDNVMEPGMLSMHHFRTVHRSGPNTSPVRRVAFVGRYMSPAIRPETAESGQATLVRGEDRYGHFALKARFPMTWTA